MAEVPGLRLLVDTGHVSDWGEDAVEMLEYADHVQLRQGKPGSTQVHIDDPTGVVDFTAVRKRLDQLDYYDLLQIEPAQQGEKPLLLLGRQRRRLHRRDAAAPLAAGSARSDRPGGARDRA